jgi:hypothetical protein
MQRTRLAPSVRLTRPFCLTLLALVALAAVSYFPLAKIRAASVGATILPSSGTPLVNLKGARNVKVTYTGSADAVAALQSGTANPTALASADFDADGAMDVVAGYATKNGGVLAVYKGNPDAFAPTDQTLYGKAILQGKVPPTFLPEALAFTLPESPDLLVTADFNGNGKKDVLVAARGSSNLYLLLGDGAGNLLAPQVVPLLGEVRAFDVTADGHVAVTMDGPSGSQLAILDPSSQGLASRGLSVRAIYPLPAQGNSVAWGRLGGGLDVAVGAGSNVVMIYGALAAKPQTETFTLPFQVHGLALGDFIWDRDGRTEIAVLADDGSIHILQHGTLNTTPVTAAELPARRAALRGRHTKPATAPNPTALGAWTLAKQLPYTGSAPSGPVSASAFSSPRVASSSTQDLMVLDAAASQLHILDTSGKTASPGADVSFSGTPVAALVMPNKINSDRDIVVLTSSQAAPLLVTSGASLTLNVNTTADIDSINACTTNTMTIPSTLSLREAVCLANNFAETATINVPAGTYDLTSLETGELRAQTGAPYSLTINGTGTASTTIIQQTDGVDRILEEDYALEGNNPMTIENVTLTGGNCTNTSTNDCDDGGGAVIAGATAGDNVTITNVVMSGNTAAATGGTDEEDGGGLNFAGPALTISNSTFSNNYANGSGIFNDGVGGGVFFLDQGTVGGTANGPLTITNSSFTNNKTNGGGGGGLWAEVSTGDPLTITGSTFTGNTAGGGGGTYDGGAIDAEQSGLTATTFTLYNSRIVGNSATGSGNGVYVVELTANLQNSWWGCNAGPGNTGCDTVDIESSGGFTPWLVLIFNAFPTQVDINGTSTLSANLIQNSDGGSGFSVPNGTPVTFSGTLGTVNPTNTTLTGGSAQSVYTAGGTPGAGSGTAKVDSQTVSATINIGAPPMITSASSTLFTLGTPGTFMVTTSGSPTPSLSDGGATLPSGVTFHDNGNGTATLSGTPGNAGNFPFTITASNGFGSPATQSFTLSVNQGSTSIGVTSVNPSSEVYGQDTQVTITAVLSWSGSGPAPTASDVTIGGNGPSGYSATSCGAPSGDTRTCTATYTPTGADAVGSYTESASFSGDTNYTGSSSSQTNNFSVTQATSSTSVGSSQNPSLVGQSVTFTATIDGQYGLILQRGGGALLSGSSAKKGSITPSLNKPNLTQRVLTETGKDHPPHPGGITGSVTWSANTGCAASTVSGDPGTAQCTTTSLPQGTDTITATYSGDNNHSGSSGSLNGGQIVNPSITPTTISVTSVSPSSEAYGQDAQVAITAVLSWTGNGPAPTASDITIGGNGPSGYSATSCGAPSSDTLTCTASYTPTGADTVGSYTETASFSGDSNYSGSSSPQTNNFSITQATSSTSVGSSQNPSVVGQSVTFTATIDGEYGLILQRGGALLSRAVPSGSSAKKGSITPGSNKPGLTQRVLTQKGQEHPPTPVGITGSVTWSANTGCGSTTVSGGTTQCITSTLPQGTDTITADYSGDNNHSGSSGTLAGGQVVNPSITGTTIAVTNVSPASEAYGQDAPVTITAALSWTGNGPAPTASDVTIGGNGPSGYSATTCGAPISDTLTCTATYTPTAADGVGSYTETASFSGDSNYSGSSSTQSNNFSIAQATSSTSVGSNLNPSELGQAVTFTATIDGEYGPVKGRQGALRVNNFTLTKKGLAVQRGQATRQGLSGGTVTWSANTGCSPSGVASLPGTATCTTSTLPSGNNVITATYSGDIDHAGSSGTLSGGQQVNGQAPAITSANSTTFALNSFNSFPVTTTGNPTPSLNESGGLPNGVHFTDNHDGTGTLSGTPTVTGIFNIMFTASNGVGSPATQNFTLTVSGASVTLTPTSIDFGTAYLNGKKGKATVTVKNTGTSTLSITQVLITPGPGTGPNDFTFHSYCMAPLKPGKTCLIGVLFAPDDVGSLSATLNIADNAPGSPQQVSLKATVINPVPSFNPTKLNFPTTMVGQSSGPQNVTLTNVGTTSLDLSSITAGGAHPGDYQVDGSACPSSLAPTDSCTIAVTFMPTAKGTRAANVTVIDNAKINKQTVPLSGKGD